MLYLEILMWLAIWLFTMAIIEYSIHRWTMHRKRSWLPKWIFQDHAIEHHHNLSSDQPQKNCFTDTIKKKPELQEDSEHCRTYGQEAGRQAMLGKCLSLARGFFFTHCLIILGMQ